MISIDFKKPVRPGDIYAILVPPGSSNHPAPSEPKRVQLVSILMHIEGAPRVQTIYDAISQKHEHTIQVPSSKGDDIQHAIATVQLRLGNSQNLAEDDSAGRVDDDRP